MHFYRLFYPHSFCIYYALFTAGNPISVQYSPFTMDQRTPVLGMNELDGTTG